MTKKRIENVKHVYYEKDKHPSLKGHTIQVDIYHEKDGTIIKDHIILTQKDLVIAALKKHDYFNDR
ncbi:MAG: hypothetical protein QXI16_03190 [Sulfolobaceae archaeon]